MRTNFSAAQLVDPHLAAAEKQLRACVHCGICTATCPTYTLLGDELDGPRGRIQLIQHMLETDGTPSAKVVTHIDRCLSCLACVSACPSGVNYPRLIDEARAHIERKATRPFAQRWLRQMLGTVLPDRRKLRVALTLARLGAVAAPLLPKALRVPAQTAARLAVHGPARQSAATTNRETAPAKRVALHMGCVQEVVAPHITAAAIRVLTRHGFEVTTVEGTGCCGSLNHHLGQTAEAERHATALVNDIAAEDAHSRFDAIVTTASGCATTIRDYGFHLSTQGSSRRRRPHARHRRYSERCATAGRHRAQRHPRRLPFRLLDDARLEATDNRARNCCASSASTSSSRATRTAAARPASTTSSSPISPANSKRAKRHALMAIEPQIVATGNIGCWAQIKAAVPCPWFTRSN